MDSQQAICTDSDIKRLGTICLIGAHPDDETFMAAGIMATAIANGQTVVCITATRGEAGVQDETRWPAAQLKDIRTQELEAALQILGVRQHHWFEYADGSCQDVAENEVLPRIAALLNQYRPDSILTFGPEGMTGHPDHQAVSRWADAACAELEFKPTIYHAVHTLESYEQHLKKADEQFNIFYNIDKPPLEPEGHCAICYHLTPNALHKKHQALAAMTSQTENLLMAVKGRDFAAAFGVESFVKA